MYHRKLIRVAAGAAIVTLAAVGLHGSSALADVPNGSWTITTRNASDPFVVGCTIGNETYICMYASSDMPNGGYTGNPYPMNATYLYTLDKDLNPGTAGNWVDRGAILQESVHYSSWVPSGANHVWAPAMASGLKSAVGWAIAR